MKPIELSQAASFLGDSADCMVESMETLALIEKQLPSHYRARVKALMTEIAAVKTTIECLKGEMHGVAYAQQPCIFSQPVVAIQAQLSRYSQAH